MKLTSFVASFGVFVLASCTTGPIDSRPSPSEQPSLDAVIPQPVDTTFHWFRFNNGVTDARRSVIRDEATWTALWSQIVSTHWPKPPAPAVDFSKEMVLFAAMGTRNSGGYVMSIDSVRKSGGALEVVVRATSPGPQCGTTAALTQPIAAVRVARNDLPVAFIERTGQIDCR